MSSALPLNVLIVEDDAILAVELAAITSSLGYNVVGLAIDLTYVVQLCATTRVDVALVDLNLNDGPTGATIARRLVREHAASVIFVTASMEQLPDDFCGALGVVPKPYDSGCFAEVLAFAMTLRNSVARPPRQLLPAPWLRHLGLQPATAQAAAV